MKKKNHFTKIIFNLSFEKSKSKCDTKYFHKNRMNFRKFFQNNEKSITHLRWGKQFLFYGLSRWKLGLHCLHRRHLNEVRLNSAGNLCKSQVKIRDFWGCIWLSSEGSSWEKMFGTLDDRRETREVERESGKKKQ